MRVPVNTRQMLAAVLTACVADLVRSSACTAARRRCMSRLGCGMALKTFILNCNNVMESEHLECHELCKHALVSLLSTDRKLGAMFIQCDCEGNAFCEYRKMRITTCAHDVFTAMQTVDDDVTVLNCTLAMWICNADTSCYTALYHYYEYCSQLYSPTDQPECDSHCNNSLAVLYHQKKAKKLKNCQCDQSADVEYKRCLLIKQNTERYCFHRQPQIQFHVSTVTFGNISQTSRQQTPLSWLLIISVFLFACVSLKC